MGNRATGRPRGGEAAAPELQGADGLTLARWMAGATAGGLTQASAAHLAGISRRHGQRLLEVHAADAFVSRDRLIAQALRWEAQAGEALQEATSRARSWLRRCEAEGADLRETAAALGATIQAAHRLGEAGARRARRLQPEAPQQERRFDSQAFLASVATACQEIRALPPEQQEQGWQQLRQEMEVLKPGQQPIDVQVIEAQEEEVEAMPCPLI